MEDSSEDLSSSQDAGNTPPPPKRKQTHTSHAAMNRKEQFQQEYKYKHGHRHKHRKKERRKGGERASRGKRRHVTSSSSASDDSTSYDSPPDGDHVTSKKARKPKVKRLCQSNKVCTVNRRSALLKIFRRHYSNLEKMISMCVTSITSQLYSRNLISSDMQEQLVSSQDAPRAKASKLLLCVKQQLEMDPEKIQALLEVLREDSIFDDLASGITSEWLW